MNDAKEIADLGDRRDSQHKAHEKFRSKTSVVIPKQSFQEGDLVMYRTLSDYNQKRDTFVVIKQIDDMVEIRKMNNQLRMKTYKVKAELLVPIFKNHPCSAPDDSAERENLDASDGKSLPCQNDPMDDTRPGVMKDPKFWEDARQTDSHSESVKAKSSRKAKTKAKMAIADQVLSKLIAIKVEKENK